ncbi:MAG: 3'(2'),5'-bisphosphate nucleotidase CysQ [Proteobacteria bacterium]|nr:3'(2'),5'-bisphosphate nucleotidase CysQ [Pseudomonadota bacterium]
MLERELREATSLAREAGRILLELYHTDVVVDFKGRSDPVTEADKRANTYIVNGLRARFQDGVVAEETEDTSDALRKGRCWYVDPLDGTKEFLARNGEFSVMIGLAIDGRAQLGVVYQPVTDKLYRGVVGERASLHYQGRETHLCVSELAEPSELALIMSRSHGSIHIDQLVERLAIKRTAKSGSVGLKIGQIAERKADLYVLFSDRSCAWDACAPEAVLRAAGGQLTDLAAQPLHYGGTDVRNRRGLLACNAAAFDAVRPVVAALGSEHGLV